MMSSSLEINLAHTALVLLLLLLVAVVLWVEGGGKVGEIL